MICDHLIRQFAARCQLAFDTCILHKELFDRNIEHGYMKIEPFYNLFGLISHVTQEHSLLQIVKLHDPAFDNKGNANLSIDYIIEQGTWADEVTTELRNLRNVMKGLYKLIKPARHKALCHNDIASILAGKILGDFEKDGDEPYFDALENFLDLIHQHSFGEAFKFDRSLKSDIKTFIDHFNRRDILQQCPDT